MSFLLLVPFFLIRFVLLAALNTAALPAAAHFAPMQGAEKAAYWLYQLSTVAIVVCPFFQKIKFVPAALFYTGAAVYLIGLALLIAAIVSFAAPAAGGFHQNGMYRFSRNPLYVAYFVFFIGCVLLTQSLVLLALVLVFQACAHRVIRAEERWCAAQFGGAYRQYRQKVRRY